MKLIDVHRQFQTEDQCLSYLETMRWPNGFCCVHCGAMNASKITREASGKNKRARIYQCLEKECGKQFSATSGTIFNDTHLPLTKWFMALALICEAKKGISAKQIERHLGVNYRTAWHLCHRIRAAMQDGGLLTGEVDADESYFGARKPRKGRPYVKKDKKDVPTALVTPSRIRLRPLSVCSSAASNGTFHRVSIKHLGRYCDEFSYRFNRRGEQSQMFDATLKSILKEKALPYKKLTASLGSES